MVFKKISLIIIIVFISFGCREKKVEMLKKFYISQSRDIDLLGRYKNITEDSTNTLYISMESSGIVIESSAPNFDSIFGGYSLYWYTSNDTIFYLRTADLRNNANEHYKKYHFNLALDTLNTEFINVKGETLITEYVRY